MKQITFAKYTAGDGMRSVVEVRDPQTQVLVDPTTIIMRLRNPSGTETGITPVRLDVGTYEATAVLDVAGIWHRQWKTTDPTGVDEETLIVEKTNFT